MFESKCHFLDDTLALLEMCQEPRTEIAKGAGVDYGWLMQVAQGKISDPGIRRLWKLRVYLVNNPMLASTQKNKAPSELDVRNGAEGVLQVK